MGRICASFVAAYHSDWVNEETKTLGPSQVPEHCPTQARSRGRGSCQMKFSGWEGTVGARSWAGSRTRLGLWQTLPPMARGPRKPREETCLYGLLSLCTPFPHLLPQICKPTSCPSHPSAYPSILPDPLPCPWWQCTAPACVIAIVITYSHFIKFSNASFKLNNVFSKSTAGSQLEWNR